MASLSVYQYFLGAILTVLVWVACLTLLGYARRANRKTISQTPASDTVAFVIILVHGTFGWFSSWLSVGSPLRNAVSDCLGAHVCIQRVKWSGWNSFRARRNGAANLKKKIMANRATWPNAKQLVIAHSHGGTLAYESLGDPQCAAGADGLICMATPFLMMTKYRLPSWSPYLRRSYNLAGVAAVMVSMIVLYQQLIAQHISQGWRAAIQKEWQDMAYFMYQSSFGFSIWLIILACLSGLVVWAFAGLRRLVNHYEQVVKKATATRPYPAEKILLLRQPGDEAAGVIAGSHVAIWPLGIFVRLLGALLAPFDIAYRCAQGSKSGRMWRGIYGWMISSGSVAAVFLFIFYPAWTSPWTLRLGEANLILFCFIVLLDWLGAMILFGVFAFFAITAVIVGVMATMQMLQFVSLFPACLFVGPEMLVAGFRCRVTAESTPEGAWAVTTVPFRNDLTSSVPLIGALWHSHLYESVDALNEMSIWMAAWKKIVTNNFTQPVN